MDHKLPSPYHKCGHVRVATSTKYGVRTVLMPLPLPEGYVDVPQLRRQLAAKLVERYLTQDLGWTLELIRSGDKFRWMYTALFDDVAAQSSENLIKACTKDTDFSPTNVPIDGQVGILLTSETVPDRYRFGVVVVKFSEVYYHVKPCPSERIH